MLLWSLQNGVCKSHPLDTFNPAPGVSHTTKTMQAIRQWRWRRASRAQGQRAESRSADLGLGASLQCPPPTSVPWGQCHLQWVKTQVVDVSLTTGTGTFECSSCCVFWAVVKHIKILKQIDSNVFRSLLGMWVTKHKGWQPTSEVAPRCHSAFQRPEGSSVSSPPSPTLGWNDPD